MLKRYFIKCVFLEGVDILVDEIDIDETLIPINDEVVKNLLFAIISSAAECGIKIKVTLWVEHEDGSREEIQIPETSG